ncbi:hypothetical protein DASC09_012000 [Saccharomycopsis crataegensis]|uniref:methylmalonate-semialdehyde dehydrogenase (CoA acylating) n=1 Tax=Saccharomycopsis crataegensis TaxID=43959 RepID=A0AAV5QHM7_9ASCO|nr:hypothetical protein DASC09_012000 [Saccharomycopsis crataegensis]
MLAKSFQRSSSLPILRSHKNLRLLSTLKLNTTTSSYFKSHLEESAKPYVTPSFVNNTLFQSSSNEWFDLHDPATNKVIAKVPQSTDQELEDAIATADKTFESFKNVSIIKRQQMLFKYVRLLRENHDRLASVIVLEQGKTFDDAKGDVLRGLQVAEYACSITTELLGTNLEVSTDMETKMIREPIGVVGSICPFNFPAMIPLWTIPLVIATGNTTVVKPSERVPGATMIIAELAKEAGVPPGVINIIHGKHKTVNKIIKDPRIKAVTFVGSNRAGEYIYETANALGKRVQANLGAKNHMIVLPDADKKQAISGIIGSAFGAAGQRCMAISVLVTVGDDAHSWIMPEIVAAAKALRVGSGFDPKSELGPVISKQALSRAESIIEQSVSAGKATLAIDGRGYRPEGFPEGYFIGPTILENVALDAPCYTEEIFAPILSVVNVPTLSDAIKLVNANPYGNGVSLFTTNGIHAKKFERNIDVGQVGINVPIPVPLPMFGFTGSRGSFLGDLNFYGKAGLWFMTKPKTITALWKTSLINENEGESVTSMPTHS